MSSWRPPSCFWGSLGKESFVDNFYEKNDKNRSSSSKDMAEKNAIETCREGRPAL